jgi:lipid A 4'-phosphatase
MNRKPLFFSMVIGAIATGIVTLIFYATDLDLQIAGVFYDPDGNNFPTADLMPWAWFNKNDDLLVYLLVALTLFLFILGCIKPQFRPFLVYALFMVVSYLVGPGLIANVLFKGVDIGDFYIGWGRPRPREIIQFGGTADFYRVWEPAFLDETLHDTNSSFPSGHVTVGAIFIVIFFVFNNVEFMTRIFGEKTRAKSIIINLFKYGGLASSIVLGILLAISRISAGAHFASDCLYSFVFTWLPTVVLYYWVFNIPKLEARALARMNQAGPAILQRS